MKAIFYKSFLDELLKENNIILKHFSLGKNVSMSNLDSDFRKKKNPIYDLGLILEPKELLLRLSFLFKEGELISGYNIIYIHYSLFDQKSEKENIAFVLIENDLSEIKLNQNRNFVDVTLPVPEIVSNIISEVPEYNSDTKFLEGAGLTVGENLFRLESEEGDKNVIVSKDSYYRYISSKLTNKIITKNNHTATGLDNCGKDISVVKYRKIYKEDTFKLGVFDETNYINISDEIKTKYNLPREISYGDILTFESEKGVYRVVKLTGSIEYDLYYMSENGPVFLYNGSDEITGIDGVVIENVQKGNGFVCDVDNLLYNINYYTPEEIDAEDPLENPYGIFQLKLNYTDLEGNIQTIKSNRLRLIQGGYYGYFNVIYRDTDYFYPKDDTAMYLFSGKKGERKTFTLRIKSAIFSEYWESNDLEKVRSKISFKFENDYFETELKKLFNFSFTINKLEDLEDVFEIYVEILSLKNNTDEEHWLPYCDPDGDGVLSSELSLIKLNVDLDTTVDMYFERFYCAEGCLQNRIVVVDFNRASTSSFNLAKIDPGVGLVYRNDETEKELIITEEYDNQEDKELGNIPFYWKVLSSPEELSIISSSNKILTEGEGEYIDNVTDYFKGVTSVGEPGHNTFKLEYEYDKFLGTYKLPDSLTLIKLTKDEFNSDLSTLENSWETYLTHSVTRLPIKKEGIRPYVKIEDAILNETGSETVLNLNTNPIRVQKVKISYNASLTARINYEKDEYSDEDIYLFWDPSTNREVSELNINYLSETEETDYIYIVIKEVGKRDKKSKDATITFHYTAPGSFDTEELLVNDYNNIPTCIKLIEKALDKSTYNIQFQEFIFNEEPGLGKGIGFVQKKLSGYRNERGNWVNPELDSLNYNNNTPDKSKATLGDLFVPYSNEEAAFECHYTSSTSIDLDIKNKMQDFRLESGVVFGINEESGDYEYKYHVIKYYNLLPKSSMSNYPADSQDVTVTIKPFCYNDGDTFDAVKLRIWSQRLSNELIISSNEELKGLKETPGASAATLIYTNLDETKAYIPSVLDGDHEITVAWVGYKEANGDENKNQYDGDNNLVSASVSRSLVEKYTGEMEDFYVIAEKYPSDSNRLKQLVYLHDANLDVLNNSSFLRVVGEVDGWADNSIVIRKPIDRSISEYLSGYLFSTEKNRNIKFTLDTTKEPIIIPHNKFKLDNQTYYFNWYDESGYNNGDNIFTSSNGTPGEDYFTYKIGSGDQGNIQIRNTDKFDQDKQTSTATVAHLSGEYKVDIKNGNEKVYMAKSVDNGQSLLIDVTNESSIEYNRDGLPDMEEYKNWYKVTVNHNGRTIIGDKTLNFDLKKFSANVRIDSTDRSFSFSTATYNPDKQSELIRGIPSVALGNSHYFLRPEDNGNAGGRIGNLYHSAVNNSSNVLYYTSDRPYVEKTSGLYLNTDELKGEGRTLYYGNENTNYLFNWPKDGSGNLRYFELVNNNDMESGKAIQYEVFLNVPQSDSVDCVYLTGIDNRIRGWYDENSRTSGNIVGGNIIPAKDRFTFNEVNDNNIKPPTDWGEGTTWKVYHSYGNIVGDKRGMHSIAEIKWEDTTKSEMLNVRLSLGTTITGDDKNKKLIIVKLDDNKNYFNLDGSLSEGSGSALLLFPAAGAPGGALAQFPDCMFLPIKYCISGDKKHAKLAGILVRAVKSYEKYSISSNTSTDLYYDDSVTATNIINRPSSSYTPVSWETRGYTFYVTANIPNNLDGGTLSKLSVVVHSSTGEEKTIVSGGTGSTITLSKYNFKDHCFTYENGYLLEFPYLDGNSLTYRKLPIRAKEIKNYDSQWVSSDGIYFKPLNDGYYYNSYKYTYSSSSYEYSLVSAPSGTDNEFVFKSYTDGDVYRLLAKFASSEGHNYYKRLSSNAPTLYLGLYKLNTIIPEGGKNYSVYYGIVASFERDKAISNSTDNPEYTYTNYLDMGYTDPFQYFLGNTYFFMRDENGDKVFRFAGVLPNKNSIRDGKGSAGNLVDTGELETRSVLVRGYTYLVYRDAVGYRTFYTRNPYSFSGLGTVYSDPLCKDSTVITPSTITVLDKTDVHAINFYKTGSVIENLTDSSLYSDNGIGYPRKLGAGSNYIVRFKKYDESGNDKSRFIWYKSALQGREPGSATRLVLIANREIPNTNFFLQEGQIIDLNSPLYFSSLYYQVGNSDYYVYAGNDILPQMTDSFGDLLPAEEVYFKLWSDPSSIVPDINELDTENLGVCFKFDGVNLNNRPSTKMMYGVSKGLSEDVQLLYHIDRIIDSARSDNYYVDYAVTIEPRAGVSTKLYTVTYNNEWNRRIVDTGKTITFANVSNSNFPNRELRLFRYKYSTGLTQSLFLPIPEGISSEDINTENFLGGEEKEILVSLKNPSLKVTVPNFSFDSSGGELRKDISVTNGYTVSINRTVLPAGIRAELVYKNGEPNDEYWSSYIGYEKRELKFNVEDRYTNHNIINNPPSSLGKITYEFGNNYYTRFVSNNNLESDYKYPSYQLSISGLNYSIYFSCNGYTYEYIENENTLYFNPISDTTTELSFVSYVKNLLTGNIEENGLKVVKEDDRGNIIKSMTKDGNNYSLDLYRNKTKFDKTCTLKFTCLKDSNTTALSVVITQKAVVDSLQLSYDLDVPNHPLTGELEYIADGTLVYKGIDTENKDKNNGTLYIRTNMLNDIVDSTKLTLKEKKDKIYDKFRITIMGVPVFYEVFVVSSSKGDLFYTSDVDSIKFDSVYKTFKLINVTALPNIVQVVQQNTQTSTLFSMVDNPNLNKLFTSKRGYFLVKFCKCAAEDSTIHPTETTTGETEWNENVVYNSNLSKRPDGYTNTKYKEDRNPTIVFYEDSVFMNLVHGTELSSGVFSKIPLSYIIVSVYDQQGQLIQEKVENVQISNTLELKPEEDQSGEYQPILQGVLKDVDFSISPSDVVIGSRTYRIPEEDLRHYWLLRYVTTTNGNYLLRNTINMEYRNRLFKYPFKCKLEVYYLLKN